MADAAPLLIAFDGSDAARRAVAAAGELFPSRSAIVTTVWEPGLAHATAALPTSGLQIEPSLVDIGEAQRLEEDLEAHARRIAEEGAELAKSAGLEAQPVAIAGGARPADALIELAHEQGAAAIVVGSRGLSGLRARLEGSTSSRVAKEASCPVVVVHDA